MTNLPMITSLEKNVNFRQLKEKTFRDCDFTYFSIRNSIMKTCKFENVLMKNCDLLSTKIYSCTFNDSSFNNADLFSLWFADCKFTKVDFSGASLEDITFLNCEFNECQFKENSLKMCEFESCEFRNIQPSSTIWSLNNYMDCQFTDCIFGGSFYYQIFRACKFENTIMESNLLKYNYGLGVIQGIFYRNSNGELEDIKNLKELLINECINQKLFINSVIVDYNFSKEINADTAVNSIKAIEKMINNDFLIQNDELSFLKRLYHYFYINKLIAPISLYKLFEEFKKIYLNDSLHNISYLKCRDNLYLVANTLYIDFAEFCEKLKQQICKMNCNTPIYIQIHYDYEPTISLESLLNECYPGSLFRIETKNGSFFEILEASEIGFELLNIFLQILGISIPIIYSEFREKKKKDTQNIIIEKNLEINISNAKKESNTAELIQKTCELINSSNVLTYDQAGFNNKNIKEIKVQYKINIQA